MEPFLSFFEVQQPSFLDPVGLVSGKAPQSLMLFFEVDLDFGDDLVGLSICPSSPGTADEPGACECVSLSDCAAKCVYRDGVLVTWPL